MKSLQATPQVEYVVREIDRLIAEMTALRNQVAALGTPRVGPLRSVREAEYFGMWADRQETHGQTSREWLDSLRSHQWAPR